MSYQYTLPLLPRHDIITILTDHQIINVTDADLTQPSPNFVFKLFTNLLLHLNFLQDDPSQVEFGALEWFDNPEMHADACRVMNLFMKVKEVLASIDCPIEFMLSDLVCPDANRNYKFLSALLNYHLHRESKLNMLQSYNERLDVLEEQRRQKESKILELSEQIAAIKEMREMEKPIVLEAEAKVKELQQALDSLNNLQSHLRKERQTMKEKENELTSNVSAAEFKLIQATGENATLRSQIVQSPDKLQSALEEKKAVEVEAKASEKAALQRYQERTASLEAYTKALQKMSKQLALMQAIQEQTNTAKSSEKDVKQLKAKLSDDQMLAKSLQAKITECEAKAEQLDKQKQQLEREVNLRREEDTRGLNAVKMEAESRRCDLEARRRKIEATLAEADTNEAKINSVKERAAATQFELLRKSEEIVNEVIVYSSFIDKVTSKFGAKMIA